MTTTIIVILLILLAALAWKLYINSLEHGELKANYSKLVHVTRHMPQPPDPLLFSLCAAGVKESSPTPVPTTENKGRPFINYETFSLHAANGMESKMARNLVKCHACKSPCIIFTNFPLHGMGKCPHCNSTMTW